MKQFYFYDSYAKLICNLSHKEAGQVVKLICSFMLQGNEPNEKAMPKARATFFLMQEQLSEGKEKENAAAKRNAQYFPMPLSYAKFFIACDDTEAGLLIKRCCNFQFATPPLTKEEETQIDGYFTFMKNTLKKSKRQSENAKRRKVERTKQDDISANVHAMEQSITPMTLEKIRADFPEIRGGLNANNPILDGVDLDELYAFIKGNGDIRTLSMYSIAERFRQHKGI